VQNVKRSTENVETEERYELKQTKNPRRIKTNPGSARISNRITCII